MTEYIEREALLSAAKDYDWIAGLKTVMKRIPTTDVRPVVLCRDCKHNNACLTQAFVEDESRVQFDRSAFFCADGERKRNADN